MLRRFLLSTKYVVLTHAAGALPRAGADQHCSYGFETRRVIRTCLRICLEEDWVIVNEDSSCLRKFVNDDIAVHQGDVTPELSVT